MMLAEHVECRSHLSRYKLHAIIGPDIVASASTKPAAHKAYSSTTKKGLAMVAVVVDVVDVVAVVAVVVAVVIVMLVVV